jgi:hypothetical protein
MNAHTALTGSEILDTGHAPGDWVRTLAARGIEISERTLRERANRLGACHRLGRAMIITPAQMDTILEGGETCPSSTTSEAKPGGPRAASNTSVNRSPNTSDAAREHLLSRLRENGAGPKKKTGSVVSFSATKRQSGR